MTVALASLIIVGWLGAPSSIASGSAARVMHVWLASGLSHPPPPSPKLAPYLPQFWSLLSSYNAATAEDRQLPFGLWLIVNGIIEPAEHHAMLALYAWWTETIRRPAAAT
ncbi:MAG TPA: hypothetical protein PKC43_07310 [Phycisphaerales bacterium]|nr:hypothetical protein [Phycisphaerales bacterium]HMP37243.1 hypothetical protein [Phycisphaerales bacterium]